MSQHGPIPQRAIQRLSRYLRELERLQRDGAETVSSAELGDLVGAGDAQVRRDLAFFGHLGQRGVGYSVATLIEALRSTLSLNREWRVALVGAGNIGRALCTYKVFRERGFRIVALFDNDPRKEGCTWARLKVMPMRELRRTVQKLGIELGVIAVPPEAAQEVADQLVAAGARGILNFAPTRVRVPPGIQVCSADLAVEMEQLAFLVANADHENQQH